MNSDTGKELMDGAQSINAHLGNIAELVELIEDETLKKKIKRELGLVVGKVYIGVMAPVLREHPELDPDSPSDIEAASRKA